jgi:hypothetical protein
MPEILTQPTPQRLDLSRWDWSLWRRWVVANALGELVGLGATAVAGVALAQLFAATLTTFASLAGAGAMILLGTFEGVVVGLAQWLALRRPFPALSRRAWVLASAAGAFAAWTLGMIPSTLIDFGADAGAAPPAGMSDTLMYALAAAMGAALGPILGLPQWLALRPHARRAAWWIAANAAAWTLGMPIVFIGASSAPAGGWPGLVATGLLTATAAGAMVGAVHGLALIWLAQPRRRLSSNSGKQNLSTGALS